MRRRFKRWQKDQSDYAGFAVVCLSMYMAVLQRTREIGVRMALGCRPAEVFRLVLGQGLRLAVSGAVLGLVGALAFTRYMKTLLFEVSSGDPLTLGGVAALLIAVQPSFADGQIHIVQPGETLFLIGLRYGLTWTRIQAANGLAGEKVYAGQSLIIPLGDASSPTETPIPEPTATATPEPP